MNAFHFIAYTLQKKPVVFGRFIHATLNNRLVLFPGKSIVWKMGLSLSKFLFRYYDHPYLNDMMTNGEKILFL